MKSLGYSNGWSDRPKELKDCEEKKHILQRKPHPTYRCVTISECQECNFQFLTDSSD
jgi:hypothetical protein